MQLNEEKMSLSEFNVSDRLLAKTVSILMYSSGVITHLLFSSSNNLSFINVIF